MKDEIYSYNKGKTKEEKINNLKYIINLLSKNLEMNLNYINVEAIINKKEKESIKYLLILFINILKMKEIKRQHLINVYFNNKNENQKRKCVTEKEKQNKKDDNISLDIKIKKLNNNKIDYSESLKNREKNYNKSISPVKKSYNIFSLPILEDEENKDKNQFSNKKNQNYFLSKRELINEIIIIIKSIISQEEFYNFLINDSFNQKLLNIIKNIYHFHLELFNNSLISKQFLNDYIIDIKYIINKQFSKSDKINEYNKFKNYNNNIKYFSKRFKSVKAIKKYYNLNYIKEKREMKINKLENEYKKEQSYKIIYNCYKFYQKLIQVKKNKELQNFEFQEFLFKLKYYQMLKRKQTVINYIKRINNKIKNKKEMI